MLQKLRHLVSVTGQITGKCESRCGLPLGAPLLFARTEFPSLEKKNFFHANTPQMARDRLNISRRRDVLAVNKTYGKVDGEKHFGIDENYESSVYPTHDLPERLFEGIPFKDLPIVHVKATKNNTILSLEDKTVTKVVGSCGSNGFKNTKKGTNIAAQTSGFTLGVKAIKKGFKTIKVIVKGLGPGRLSALKGLQLSGLNIVSVTDRTPDFTTMRPKKQRRI